MREMRSHWWSFDTVSCRGSARRAPDVLPLAFGWTARTALRLASCAISGRLEVVLHGVFPDFASHRGTDFTRSAVMHAIVHASIDGLADVVREPAEPAGDSRHRGTRQAEGRHRITEKGCEYSGSGSAIDAMRARIFGVHRRGNERLPRRIALGGVVAIAIPVADRRAGRQKLYVYFASKTAMYESAMAMAYSAKRRALSSTSKFFVAASCRVTGLWRPVL